MKNLKRLFPFMIAIGILIFLFVFLITCNQIGYGVRENCKRAQASYQGNCVESLTQLLKDEKQAFKDRNSAIWALGQLGDKKALKTLKSYYTKVPREREPLDKVISQYELLKAIKLIESEFNLTAWAWR